MTRTVGVFIVFTTRMLLSFLVVVPTSRTTTRSVAAASFCLYRIPTITRPARHSFLVLNNNNKDSMSFSSYGINMDQNALMESDKLVVVNEKDELVQDQVVSKRTGHTFNSKTPRAYLHRAFSLFLFNKNHELLLTQRAAAKITFPNVWTNTVCSHPLLDMTPNEADDAKTAYPHFPGIKHATIRKCFHELGIPLGTVEHARIQFVSRFHYWAADTVTYGDSAPWGEHEVDYILFYKTDSETVPLQKNDDEVSDYKWVSRDELKTMMQQPDLLWSPWFVGIMERGGWDWWADLENTLAGKNTNKDITFFDPPKQHHASYNLESHTRKTGVLE